MHLYVLYISSFLKIFLVLKAVENLGVSYVKGSEQYQSKLEIELRKLKFSYRVSKRGKKMFLWFVYIYVLGISCGKGLVLGIGL